MCFGSLKEPSHQDGTFEYPQHMFWLRNKKKMLRTLIWGPVCDSIICALWGHRLKFLNFDVFVTLKIFLI